MKECTKRTKRTYTETIGNYEITVKDYGYTSRAPIGVRITGTVIGECVNLCGEACYYYTCLDAYTLNEGIALARRIVSERMVSS